VVVALVNRPAGLPPFMQRTLWVVVVVELILVVVVTVVMVL
jgi:hypothetical protein